MPYDDNLHDLFPPDPDDDWEEPRDDDPGYWRAIADAEFDRKPQPWWAPAEPARAYPNHPRNRLTHLVLVDGRLVDSWSEPVERSEWAQIAEWLDEQARPREVFAVPKRLPHEDALDWLDALVGGRTALEALEDEPLPVPATIDVTRLPLSHRHRVEAIRRSLDAAAVEFWDDEVRHALHAVLLALWAEDRGVVVNAKTAAHVAGGICWMIGRANDLFGSNKLTQTKVKQHLGITSNLSSYGTTVHGALRGLQPAYGSRPWSQPDLLATGRPGFLIASVRRRLIRLRDQAIAARDQHLADEARKAAVLPSAVES